MKILHYFLRIGIGSFFVFTGVVKLLDISSFAGNVGDFGIVHDEAVLATAWAVSSLECLLGLGLIANVRGALAGISALLLVFIGVLSYGVLLGLDIECGCLGPGHQVTLKTQLSLDLVLVFCCFLIHWTRKRCGLRTMGWKHPFRNSLSE